MGEAAFSRTACGPGKCDLSPLPVPRLVPVTASLGCTAAWIFQNTENGTAALTAIGVTLVVISVIATMLLPERYKKSLEAAH